jgi:hypothetical protein
MNSPKTVEIDKIVERFWRDFNIKYCLSVALRSFGKVIGVFHVFFDEHKRLPNRNWSCSNLSPNR